MIGVNKNFFFVLFDYHCYIGVILNFRNIISYLTKNLRNIKALK